MHFPTFPSPKVLNSALVILSVLHVASGIGDGGMVSSTSEASTVDQGPKRRSFPGSKDGGKAAATDVNIAASTSQGLLLATPFQSRSRSKPAWYMAAAKREGPLIGLLSTGTAMVVLNQVIADQVSCPRWQCAASASSLSISVVAEQDIADSSVQALAWVKYGAIYFAACLAARGAPVNAHHSKEQYVLMAIIGMMDVFAYAANCLGVAFCGAALAALILAGTQQVFTAVMSYILLGRRLSWRQMSGVRCYTIHQIWNGHGNGHTSM